MKIKFFALTIVLVIALAAIGDLISSAINPDTTNPDDDNITTAPVAEVETEEEPVSDPVVFYDEMALEVVGSNPESSGYWLLTDGVYTVNFTDGSSSQLWVNRGSWSWAS